MDIMGGERGTKRRTWREQQRARTAGGFAAPEDLLDYGSSGFTDLAEWLTARQKWEAMTGRRLPDTQPMTGQSK